EKNVVVSQQVVERQGIEFALGVNAVEVDVKERDRAAAIFVDERERWTGYIFGPGGLEALGNALDQRGLARAQIAAKKNNASGPELRSQAAAQLRGLVGGMSGVFLASARLFIHRSLGNPRSHVNF